MKRVAVVLALLAMVACSARSRAQDVPEVPPIGAEGMAQKAVASRGLDAAPSLPNVELSGPVNAAVYRVGPGDWLVIHLWGPVTRSIPLEVGPEGTVLLPGLGVVPVAERTLADVRRDLLERLGRQYRNVKMDVQLARPRTFRLYLTGQVQSPGPVLATGAPRLADVLTGGALLPGGSRRRIEVRHSDGTRENGDLQLFTETGDATLNPWLREGDVVQVPTATEFVYAEGAVARPGRYELGVDDSLRSFLRLAGDPLPSAEARRVLLIRFRRSPVEPESVWFSLDQVYSRRANPKLADGDRVYVYYLPLYHQQMEATVLGEVLRPGVYPITEGLTRVSTLVTAAGGFQPSADLSSIRLHRRSPAASEKDPELDRLLRLSRNELTASEYEVLRTKLAGVRGEYRLDWARVIRDRRLDVPLRDGDSVIVERLVSSVRVDGEVRRPGILNFAQGQGVDDYVRQAGGFTDRAWKGKVRVTRSVTGQTLFARNVRTLDPGDLVWVPEKPDVTVWQQTREILTALAQVATVVIAIRSVR